MKIKQFRIFNPIILSLAIIGLMALLVLSSNCASARWISGDDDNNHPQVGVEWVNAYWIAPLSHCGQSATEFYNTVVNSGWIGSFNRGDYSAHPEDWTYAGGTDMNGADMVDLAFYSGHGAPDAIYPSPISGLDKTYLVNCWWGDGDAEWVMLDCCSAGTDTVKNCLQGAHEICGFSTTADDIDFGGTVSSWLVNNRQTVLNSWVYSGWQREHSGAQMRIWCENENCVNDCIWKSGYVISDPPVDGVKVSYTYSV